MAKNKKNVVENGKKKKRIWLWLGLGVLALGLLAGGLTFAAGILTLARDLFFTAVAINVIGLGVAGGKAVATSIKNKKAAKQPTQTYNRTRTKNLEQEIEPVPTIEQEKVSEATPVLPAQTNAQQVQSQTKRK